MPGYGIHVTDKRIIGVKERKAGAKWFASVGAAGAIGGALGGVIASAVAQRMTTTENSK